MGKSKTVGNIHLLEAEKKYNKEMLMSDIENVLFPVWDDRSEYSIKVDVKKGIYREIINTLYHGKMLNISEVQNQIKYFKEREE